jgi:hypothetical protein
MWSYGVEIIEISYGENARYMSTKITWEYQG